MLAAREANRASPDHLETAGSVSRTAIWLPDGSRRVPYRWHPGRLRSGGGCRPRCRPTSGRRLAPPQAPPGGWCRWWAEHVEGPRIDGGSWTRSPTRVHGAQGWKRRRVLSQRSERRFAALDRLSSAAVVASRRSPVRSPSGCAVRSGLAGAHLGPGTCVRVCSSRAALRGPALRRRRQAQLSHPSSARGVCDLTDKWPCRQGEAAGNSHQISRVNWSGAASGRTRRWRAGRAVGAYRLERASATCRSRSATACW